MKIINNTPRGTSKRIYARILSFAILLTGFFCLSANKVFALEVKYPIISGQDININPTLPSYVLYLIAFGMFAGCFAVFISLVIAGVMYLLSPAKPDLQAEAKDRITGAISGLLILFLSYLIIATINPQLNILNLNELQKTPPPPAAKQAEGVYFYKGESCPADENPQANTSSLPDLGTSLRNSVNSVKIIQGDSSYISILYENPNLWGKCQYIDPTNKDCQKVDHFASSASIYKYDFNPADNNPTDGGVYFFRESCFINSNDNYDISNLVKYCAQGGGYYYISNQDIMDAKGNSFALNQLYFLPDSVPVDELDCIEYDKNGKCCTENNTDLGCDKDGRQPPSLGGENISSIIINGNYLVLLVYQGPGGTESGPWTSCQEFPIGDDVNKLGPQQIKWQNIRNSGPLPNYAIIIPIQK
jgi:hypothetical protein